MRALGRRTFGTCAASLRIRIEVGTVAKAQRKSVWRVELPYAAQGEPEPDAGSGSSRVFVVFKGSFLGLHKASLTSPREVQGLGFGAVFPKLQRIVS